VYANVLDLTRKCVQQRARTRYLCRLYCAQSSATRRRFSVEPAGLHDHGVRVVVRYQDDKSSCSRVRLLSWSHRESFMRSCIISGRQVRGQHELMNIRSARLHRGFERRTSILLVRDPQSRRVVCVRRATTQFVVTPVSSTVVDLAPSVVVIHDDQLLGTLRRTGGVHRCTARHGHDPQVRPLLATKSAAEPVTGSV